MASLFTGIGRAVGVGIVGDEHGAVGRGLLAHDEVGAGQRSEK